MDTDHIVTKMNSFLHTATSVLADWLNYILPRTSDTWWEDCVMDNLSINQQELARRRGFDKLEDFDLAALLRIANKSWYVMRNVAFLPTRERECIQNMMRVRNNWAHCSAALPGKDAIVADLNTLHEFFEQRECDRSLLREVEEMVEEAKSPSTVDFASLVNPADQSFEEEKPILAEEIKEKDVVFLIGDPSVRGIVMSLTDMGDARKYEVFVNGNINTYYSGQIAPVIETKKYNWVDINTFRSCLTAYQINNPSGRELYSLNSARIDFVPYQFRPALKMIHADEPRILIADSVGVGKTIEAGIILKELEARNEVESVVVICPKPLVVERKWELEMKRFDEDFIALDGSQLRTVISDTDRDGEWPARYSKVIVPYSILDGHTYGGEKNKRKLSYGLADLDPAPHFDLVIVDEAHHIRNGSMEKEKAFNYKCVKYFCDHADAVVMLTATPLQTGNDDLYTLLNVLRPDMMIDKRAFNLMSGPNPHISACAGIIRRAKDHWKEDALKELRLVLDSQWGENVIAKNPVYALAVQTLQQEKISREQRVRLISEVESLHSFNTMINRTRRKDIEDFCVRQSKTLEVEFTPAQQELHDELLRFERSALQEVHGDPRIVPFMMSMIKRQAASCIFGLAPHIRSLINRRFAQLEEDPDYEYESRSENEQDLELSSSGAKILTALAQKLLQMADNLPPEDTKFDKMMAVIREKQKSDNNKIIIFSTFRYTLSYLKEKLLSAGLRVEQIDGSVKDEDRQALRTRFELPKENKSAIDILLFTEVGSEGLDYQFCNMMINYDLPWNPMRIEQRIGRIDRRGQKSETVTICNMITSGTVDAEIYHRCLDRIGIFKQSIGDCEEILGEIATQIDQIALNPTLTEQQRQIKLDQMADNEIRKIQELNNLEEQEKEFFGFNLSEYMTSQEIHRAENPWMTPECLLVMIEGYLNARLGKGVYIVGEGDIKQLRLSAANRKLLREDFQRLAGGKNFARQTWDHFLKGTTPTHRITFNSDGAEKERDAFFITSMHPLAKQAAAYYGTKDFSYIRFRYASDDLPEGMYHFSVYAWKYVGMDPHSRMTVVCDNDEIAAELPDILQEAQSSSPAIQIKSFDWNALEKKHISLWRKEKDAEIARSRNAATFKKESLTNNYNNNKRTLEQRLNESQVESMQRMYISQLASAEEKYNEKIDEIERKVKQTDIHTTLIANGVLEIE